MSISIELSKLKSRLWEAADILQGPVGAADPKTYIFSLPSLKPPSEVYDEVLSAASGASGSDMEVALFEENHWFFDGERVSE